VTLASAATALSVVAWTTAPYTGVSILPEAALSTTRYLLPGLAAAATALALAARGRDTGARMAIAILAIATAIQIIQTLDLGVPAIAPTWVPASGALAGAVAGALLARRRLPWLRPLPAAAGAVTAVLLALATPGWLERHAALGGFEAPLLRHLREAAAWDSGRTAVAAVRLRPGILAGERLEHPVTLLPQGPTCADVRNAAERGWLVVYDLRIAFGSGDRPGVQTSAADTVDHRCLGGRRPDYEDGPFRAYRPR
jgi:hypothetical protein